jgi:hypothetical protein
MNMNLIFSAVDPAKSAVGLAKSVAEMLGVIQSLEAKVDRLVRSELNAGFRNLDDACIAADERDSLLREARGCFTKAVGLESGFRQGLALLGCAVCHHHLGDTNNCRRCLSEILQLRPLLGVIGMLELLPSTEDGNHLWAMGGFLVLMGICFQVGLIRNGNATAWWSIWFTSFLGLAIGIFLLVKANRMRVTSRKKRMMQAVNVSSDARSLLQLQQAVSQYTRSPVEWLAELEPGRF